MFNLAIYSGDAKIKPQECSCKDKLNREPVRLSFFPRSDIAVKN